MKALKALFGLEGPKPAPAPRMEPTGLSARDWIVDRTNAKLEITEGGAFPTPEGKATIIDPLCLTRPTEWIDVPKDGGSVVVFHDREEGRNSKLALIFSDVEVAGGDDVSTCLVDAGMGSVFTPATYEAAEVFRESLGEKGNIYDDYFCRFDDPGGGERKMANLPDGTQVPYVHSGWGDGAYPVFTLVAKDGSLTAIYTDFMGYNDDGDFLTPPGFVVSDK